MPSELDQPWESAASSAPMVHGSACVIEIIMDYKYLLRS